MSNHPTWDPGQYRRYAGERSRPFFDLVGRVGAERASRVVDLGCGDGTLTATLAARWPDAQVEGVDRSPEMIAGAEPRSIPGRLWFALGDLRDWRPATPVDVVVSNAALQWVPEHEALLRKLVEALAPGGWLAFQVPSDRAPALTILAELRASPRWRDRLAEATPGPRVREPVEYLECLGDLGCAADVWETTYLHVLPGEDAVLEWVKGTALRPVLSTLEGDERDAFLSAYAARLREAYPARSYGTVLAFRRILAVAQRR
jgi:trans-aconitate 2-methyltransferase